jgi:hypothetical protein
MLAWVNPYNCLIFSINSRKISCEMFFLENQTTLTHKCILKNFNHWISTNFKCKWFLIIKRPKNFKTCFFYTSSSWKVLSWKQKQSSLQKLLNQDKNKGRPNSKSKLRNKKKNKNKNMTCARRKSNKILLQEHNKAMTKKCTQNWCWINKNKNKTKLWQKKNPNFMNIHKVMGNFTSIYIHWAFSSNLHLASNLHVTHV